MIQKYPEKLMVTSQSKTKLEKIKIVSELIKNIVEVIAFLVAGAWAYSKYSESDKPLLELRASSKSDLEWYQVHQPGSCLARFGITIKNIGRKSFKIDQVIVRAWLKDQPQSNQIMKYLDAWALTDKRPIFEQKFTEIGGLGLLGNYAVDVENYLDFNFILKKQESKIALFSVKAEGAGISLEESRWSYVCDLPTKSGVGTKK